MSDTRPRRKRKQNMESAGRWVEKAINELKPAVNASCPNELAMRTVMALIRLNNAFEDAGLRPLQMMVPCEPALAQGDLFDKRPDKDFQVNNAH